MVRRLIFSRSSKMATELRRRGVPAWEVEGMLGHKRPGVTEIYAEFAPDYLSKGREAIDAYFADLGKEYSASPPDCVSSACQHADDSQRAIDAIADISMDKMVGATGIEPVTPTMST